MSQKNAEHETSYSTDVTELTGLEDLRQEQEASKTPKSLWGKIVRLVAGDAPEEHDKGRALRRAVRAQDLEQVKSMIKRGYGVNESQEASLACIASRRANKDMLMLLAEAGVDINKPDRRSQTAKARTPLQEAARKGWDEGVSLLIDLKADVDACEEGDITALHIAARLGHPKVVHLLLKHRADPCGDKLSQTSPLHETASSIIMNMLLQAGASVHQRDRNRCTPLHLQAYSGRPELVEILINAGADKNAADRKGRPPVFLIGGRGDALKTYEIFKKTGVNYKIRDASENTIAHAFAQRSHSEALLNKVFEDAPELWVTKNLSGQTPIDILIVRGQQEWAQRFKEKVAKSRTPDIGDELDTMLGRRTHH